MRERPFAFLKLGDRWVNMSQVTDALDGGDRFTLFFVSDMARLAGKKNPTPVDVARQVQVTDPDEVVRLRKWLTLNDQD